MAKHSQRNRTEDFRMAVISHSNHLPDKHIQRVGNEHTYHGNSLDVSSNLHRTSSKPVVSKNRGSRQNISEMMEVS